jgi:acyl carrier protein
MNLQTFINNFAAQFDETDVSVFGAETNFRDLNEWSSLIALAILNMIEKKYGIRLTPQEMRPINTIQDLFDLVNSKSRS